MKTSFLFFTCLVAAAEPEYFSPQALAALPGGKQLYIALGTANKIAVYEIAAGRITSAVSVPGEPTGVVAARESIYATCDGAAGAVAVIESGSIVRRIPVGPGPRAPALAPDGKTLYVANRFGDSVSIVDLDKGAETVRIPLPREPYATALTPDGKLLLAATHLPAGPATAEVVASEVCFIDVKARRLERCIPLANGSSQSDTSSEREYSDPTQT